MREYGYVLITLSAQAASILFFLTLARGLAPVEYGDSMAAVAAGLFVAGMLNFGSNSHLVREISTGSLPFDSLVARVLGRLGYSLVAALIIGVVATLISGQNWRIGAAVSLLTVVSHGTQLLLVAPLALRRLTFAGLTQLADKLFALTLAGSLYLLGLVNAASIPLMIAAGNLVSILIYSIMFANYARSRENRLKVSIRGICDRRKGEFFNPWRGSGGIGLSSVAFSMQQLDVTIIRSISGSLPAGEYAAVSRWNQPASLVAGSLGQAVLPKLSGAVDLDSALRVLVRFWPANLFIVVCSIVGIVIAGPFVELVLGESYAQSGGALKVLFAAIPISFISNQIYTVLIAQRLDRVCTKYVIAAMAFGLSIQPILAVRLGSLGAALGFAIGQVLLILFLLFVCLKYRKRP